MDRWVAKVAVVTGAASGIGRAIAKDLADRGVVVVTLDTNFEGLQTLAESTEGKMYPKVCDLKKEPEILSVFRWIESVLGGVDIMVNNAGIMNKNSLMNGKTEPWQDTLNTNVRALSICTREALKSMRQRGDNGHIFHINSRAGHVVPDNKLTTGMYAASKHAVTALAEALRIELQQANSNIKITAISPGGVNTDMVVKLFLEDGPNAAPPTKNPDIDVSQFVLQPEDVSGAFLYALGTKPNVQVHDIYINPLRQN